LLLLLPLLLPPLLLLLLLLLPSFDHCGSLVHPYRDDLLTLAYAVGMGGLVATSVFIFDVSIQYVHDLPDIFAQVRRARRGADSNNRPGCYVAADMFCDAARCSSSSSDAECIFAQERRGAGSSSRPGCYEAALLLPDA
jgi:hypothetical protein